MSPEAGHVPSKPALSPKLALSLRSRPCPPKLALSPEVGLVPRGRPCPPRLALSPEVGPVPRDRALSPEVGLVPRGRLCLLLPALSFFFFSFRVWRQSFLYLFQIIFSFRFLLYLFPISADTYQKGCFFAYAFNHPLAGGFL